MKATEYQVINIRIPHDLHEAVKKAAEDEERSMSSLIRIAVKDYLRTYHS